MDFWTIILTVIIGGIGIFLWYNMNIFRHTGIPHKVPLPIIGNMLPVLLQRIHFFDFITQNYNRWSNAKYIGFFDFITPVIIVRDIELIKSIGVKNFDNFTDHRSFISENTDPLFGKSLFSLKGNKWREVRNLLSPAFTASKMRQMSDLIASCAKDFAEFVANNAATGQQDIDVKDAFSKYTNDVIATCAFGISVNTMKDPNNDFYVYGKQVTKFSGSGTIKLLFTRFFPNLSKWLNIRIFDEKVTNFFINIVKTTIETREKLGISRADMIQLMMESKEKKNSIQLDIIDMTAQAFLFFFGGFDSSSSLMSFIAIALSLNPDIQDKLLDEVDSIMKQTNANPNNDVINAMPYLEAVIYETLRCYPIGGFIDRMCTKSFELPPSLPGLKPFTVKADMNLWIPLGAIHEDEKYYDNPKKFHPERFLNTKMTINSPTYLPFGIGPRSCIASRFALLETKLLFFHLLTKCKFSKSLKLKEPIRFSNTSFTLSIEGGFWIKIIPR